MALTNMQVTALRVRMHCAAYSAMSAPVQGGNAEGQHVDMLAAVAALLVFLQANLTG